MALAQQSGGPTGGASGGAAAAQPAPGPTPTVQTALLQTTDQTPTSPSTDTSPTEPAPQASNDKIRVGPEFGLYFPTDSKTRDAFGDHWFSIGLGIGDVSERRRDRRIALDFDLLAASRSGNEAYVAPLGASYTSALTSNTRGLIPYAGAAVDVVFADLYAPNDNTPQRLSVTGGGSAFVGLDFGETAYLEARYNEFAATRGFDLSGLDLDLGIRF
jgi:hypothetical protein